MNCSKCGHGKLAHTTWGFCHICKKDCGNFGLWWRFVKWFLVDVRY